LNRRRIYRRFGFRERGIIRGLARREDSSVEEDTERECEDNSENDVTEKTVYAGKVSMKFALRGR